MRALIATPTAGHVVTTAYAHSLIAATRAIHAAGGDYHHQVFNGADVVLARNVLADLFLGDKAMTHLLFLDSDMLVEEEVFARLIGTGRPVAGAIYAERNMDWPAFTQRLREGADEATARAAALNFNVRLIDGGVTISPQGWCRLAGIGTGCLLIAREVFEALAAKGIASKTHSRKMQTHLGRGTFCDFFGLLPADDGDNLSEDYSFCERTRQAGFDIWGLADAAVGHVGRYEYSARFVDFLDAVATREGPV